MAHDKVRLLYQLGEGFDGFEVGALWEDAKVGQSDLATWERNALGTTVEWIRNATKAMGRYDARRGPVIQQRRTACRPRLARSLKESQQRHGSRHAGVEIGQLRAKPPQFGVSDRIIGLGRGAHRPAIGEILPADGRDLVRAQ